MPEMQGMVVEATAQEAWDNFFGPFFDTTAGSAVRIILSVIGGLIFFGTLIGIAMKKANRNNALTRYAESGIVIFFSILLSVILIAIVWWGRQIFGFADMCQTAIQPVISRILGRH